MFPFLWLALVLGGCRTSCTEETGAEPVVDTSEASAPLGAPHKVANSPMRIRPIAPIMIHSAAPPANSE